MKRLLISQKFQALNTFFMISQETRTYILRMMLAMIRRKERIRKKLKTS